MKEAMLNLPTSSGLFHKQHKRWCIVTRTSLL